jgi:conjugal transfer pilus assembly protein TraW
VKAVLALIIMFMALDIQAKNFGVEGTTYPIKEQNLLEYILQRLTKMQENGEIDKINEEFKRKATESIMRPKSVLGLSNAIEDREFLYDPSITLSEAILTHDKQTIHPAGTRINPLDTVRFHYTYLFIDGDNPDQVTWALSHPARSKKIILTSGAIIDLMREHQQRLYFDQEGKLTSKFGIRYLPAQVSQFGKHLMVKEVAL